MLTRVRYIAILAGALLCLTGCLTDQVKEEGTVADVTEEQPDPSTYVCNPMDGDNGVTDRFQGVHGELYYTEALATPYRAVSDYINFGTQIPVDIFFNQIYVPTRPFDRGFVTQSGITLATQNGDTLYEWFAIRHRGQLQLGLNDPAGAYQLAVLSDDGSVMYVGPEGAETIAVNNDGFHSTKLGCGSQPIDMRVGAKLPFVLDYFQGPRFHISVILLWRPMPLDPALQNDVGCGVSGNSTWFDSTYDPPLPKPAYDGLLARGWKVVAPENLSLPRAAVANPCNEPTPVLSAVTVSGIQRTEVTASWTTDRGATSQAIVTNAATGVVVSTTATTTLVTGHSVVVTGLLANTLYRLKGVSQSSSGRSAESAEVTFRTPR